MVFIAGVVVNPVYLGVRILEPRIDRSRRCFIVVENTGTVWLGNELEPLLSYGALQPWVSGANHVRRFAVATHKLVTNKLQVARPHRLARIKGRISFCCGWVKNWKRPLTEVPATHFQGWHTQNGFRQSTHNSEAGEVEEEIGFSRTRPKEGQLCRAADVGSEIILQIFGSFSHSKLPGIQDRVAMEPVCASVKLVC